MPSLVSIDGQAFRSSFQSVMRKFDRYGKAGAAALDMAMVEKAEQLLNEMKANITHGGQIPHAPTYMLAKSGYVDGPGKEGEWTVVRIDWDPAIAPYAKIQDKGGTIYPKDVSAAIRDNPKSILSPLTPSGRRRKVTNKIRGALGRYITRRRLNTARLFVPLREGIRPIQDPVARAAAGYQWGVDYVLAKSVTIKGSEFITKVMRKHGPNLVRDIGKRTAQLWQNMVEKK